MIPLRFRSLVSFVCTAQLCAAEITPEDAQGRLAVAMQIARERNQPALVTQVEKVGRKVRDAVKSGQLDGVDAALREVEREVGIDPGGWSMAGQPLFHPTPALNEHLRETNAKLADAMKSGDAARVRAVTAEMLAVLGDQAGVPDGRRAGKKAEPRSLAPADATKLFIDALATQGRYVRQFMRAEPLPDQMLRFYAYLLDATTTARPFVLKHQPERLTDLDRLAHGLATILTKLQQPAGHFPFPDLRGKNIRFGDMINRQLASGAAEVHDGWVVSPDPDGGSQFDTSVCGVALLRAGQLHREEAWTKAGLRAADWALAQPCCTNFNYNAFSVSLLAHAWRVSGDARYLDGALQKLRVGVASGQAPNGRWLDSHNARTVYHVIILRALGELTAALPPDHREDRAEVDRLTRPAIKTLLDEFDAMGCTVEALPELQMLAALYPDDTRLRDAVAAMKSSIVSKCTDGKQVKMGAQPHQLAAALLP